MNIVLSPKEVNEITPRFWKYVHKPENASAPQTCWTWTAFKDQDGYGKIKFNYKTLGAHRVSWMIHIGSIPEGRFICHSCDNPPCVRIDHLWLGTNYHNQLDARNKGMLRSKLTHDQIKKVIERYNAGEKTEVIALDYNVRTGLIKQRLYLMRTRGIYVRTEKEYLLKRNNEIAQLYHSKKLTIKETADIFNLGADTIYDVLKIPEIINKFGRPRSQSETMKLKSQRLSNTSGQQIIFEQKKDK